jgi:transcriptional regulator with XRE-family HTH domain
MDGAMLARRSNIKEQLSGFPMHISPRRRSDNLMRTLRKQAGCWLRELREKRGLSQRELAQKVGAEYYTLISQLEHGYGRIPPNRYLAWASALAVEPQVFVRRLMTYYDSREPHSSRELSVDPFTENVRLCRSGMNCSSGRRTGLMLAMNEAKSEGHAADPLRRKGRANR